MKKYLSTRYNETSWHFGLLLLRLAAGGLMLIHGFDKLIHFAEKKGMSVIFGSPTDMILLVFAEFFCAALLVLGLFSRFALIPLIIAMAVAFFKGHEGLLAGKGNGQLPFLFMLTYITLLLTGPGKYSVDKMIAK
jgi:putative oxidoreductase